MNSLKCSASNINANELEEDVDTKLRGDAIGDTLYSQSFVLKTLLQFSDLKWNESVEEDLCFIWDMTVEKDVCEFLFEVSYPSIACSAVTKYSENRLIEIVIGILANIMCADCPKIITLDEISIILVELGSDDTLILVQVIRFITALAHTFENLQFISEDVVDKIIFILANSVNEDLLRKTMEAVAKLTCNFKLDKKFVNLSLFNSNILAYKTIINNYEEPFDIQTNSKLLLCRYMLENMSNICSYADHFENYQMLVEFQRNSSIFINEVINIMIYFSQEENLFPLNDNIIFFMSVFQYTLITLNVNYITDLFISVTKILYIISNVKDEESDLFDSVLEIECFLLSKESPKQIYKDLDFLSKDKARKILKIISENQDKYEYKFNMQQLLLMYK